MLTVRNPASAPRRPPTHFIFSAIAHLCVLALFAVALHRGRRFVAPYRLPGTEHGTNFVVSYMPDRAPEQSAVAHSRPDPRATPLAPPLPTPTPLPRTAKSMPLPSVTANASAQPNAATGADALGSGNITIALTAYFPPPHPNLSVLPRGTRGDVILDVIIDSNGRISDLKQTSGIGFGIDEIVIATVQQWIFHPALQNGHPIASEQELHFHYERS